MLQEDSSCKDRVSINKTLLGGLLLQSGAITEKELKLNDIPNATYVEFSFYNPVEVTGWSIQGKGGEMFGPIAKRRGYVASYLVTYVSDVNEGEVERIKNPATDDEVGGTSSCLNGRKWSQISFLFLRIEVNSAQQTRDTKTETRIAYGSPLTWHAITVDD